MICGLALVCASANAQPGGFGGGMPPMGGGGMPPMMGGGFGMGGAVDMTELAKFQAKQLTRELNLTPAQEKKIAKINKKELDRRMNHYLADGGSSRGGFGGMMGGGMPPMGGGMMGGGMPPMGGGGMPPMMGGGFPGFPGAENAEAANDDSANDSPELKAAKAAYNRLETMEDTKADIKAKIKIEKQMMKVLTEEQYQKWVILQQRPVVPGLRMRGVERRPEGAEFNLDALPEEAREAIKKRIESGEGFPGFPGGVPPQGSPVPPTPPTPPTETPAE